ncbi:MAG: alanine racemase [Thermoleophilia bacterium]|nr:alanine racemase [Thermoleophilia bacterium]
MSAPPRLTLDLDAVSAATTALAGRLLDAGFTLIGVTKAVDGEPAVGQAMLEAGCAGLADSRLPALTRLAAHALAPLTLIRPPQRDELELVAQVADRVVLADPAVAQTLGEHAPGAALEVLLAVDLGDRREGVLPEDAAAVAHRLAALPGIALAGIAANFACLSGQLPTQVLFRQAEAVLTTIADACAAEPLLSLGGTCCLQHLDGYAPRFATEIRSGGGPLYGYDFVSGARLEDLERRDPVLTAAVLECSRKPPAPPCETGCDAFGHVPDARLPKDDAWYALVALGRRDCEPAGLRPLLEGAYVAGMTSDVGIVIVPEPLAPGAELSFAVDYDALVRAVTSPFVALECIRSKGAA